MEREKLRWVGDEVKAQPPKTKYLTHRETSDQETGPRQHRPTHHTHVRAQPEKAAQTHGGGAHTREKGVAPVGTGGCPGLGSAALPPPAADLSFVLGQELPESGGLGWPGPGLVICNKT